MRLKVPQLPTRRTGEAAGCWIFSAQGSSTGRRREKILPELLGGQLQWKPASVLALNSACIADIRDAAAPHGSTRRAVAERRHNRDA